MSEHSVTHTSYVMNGYHHEEVQYIVCVLVVVVCNDVWQVKSD
jgi:hypothetical protein